MINTSDYYVENIQFEDNDDNYILRDIEAHSDIESLEAILGTKLTNDGVNTSNLLYPIGVEDSTDSAVKVNTAIRMTGGTLESAGNFISTSANGFRIIQDDYGFFIRNDGSNTWFLFTEAGDQYGGFNDLRPLRINNATGRVYCTEGIQTGASATIGSSTTPMYLNDGYFAACSAMAPQNHASTATTYGIGTASNYGHVKLTDTYTSNAGAASSGIAASGQAVYNVYNAVNTISPQGAAQLGYFSSLNLNDFRTGLALVNTTINGPDDSVTWWCLIGFGIDTGTGFQIIIRLLSPKTAYGRYLGSGTWGSWTAYSW